MQSIPTWLEASGEWGLPCRARHVAHFWRAGAYDGVSKEPFLPLALLLLPLPSSSASATQKASAVWDKAQGPGLNAPGVGVHAGAPKLGTSCLCSPHPHTSQESQSSGCGGGMHGLMR